MGILPYYSEELSTAVVNEKIPIERLKSIPLLSKPSFEASWLALKPYYRKYEIAKKNLVHGIAQRPLYAYAWLLLADLNYQTGEKQRALTNFEIGSYLWPTRSIFQWNAAMKLIQYGYQDQALSALSAFVHTDKKGFKRALLAALNISTNTETILDKFIIRNPVNSADELKLLLAIFGTAIESSNLELAESAWNRLPLRAKEQPETFLAYVNLLIEKQLFSESIKIWEQIRNERITIDSIYNQDFEEPAVNGGFSWHCIPIKGFKCKVTDKVSFSGRRSYKFTFDGEQNLNLFHFKQIIPVNSSTKYNLSGYWRGQNLTTLSGVFFTLRGLDGSLFTKTEQKIKSWDWEKFDLNFETGANTEFVELRLRRKQTSALDNLFAGQLWIDDFQLKVNSN